MRLGIALPTTEIDGAALRAESLADAARRIEEAGFAIAWYDDVVLVSWRHDAPTLKELRGLM